MDFVLRARPGSFDPNADVFVDEERRRVVAVLEIAGADGDTLHIGVDERALVVTGRRFETARFGSGSIVQKEIACGPFSKSIPLPVAVEYEGAVASYADGLLVVSLPIAATAYRLTARTEIHVMVQRTH